MDDSHEFSLQEAIDRVCNYCVKPYCLDNCPIHELASYHSNIINNVE